MPRRVRCQGILNLPVATRDFDHADVRVEDLEPLGLSGTSDTDVEDGEVQVRDTVPPEIVHELREALKSGRPLEAAIQKAGVKAETVPPFSLLEDKTEGQGNESKKEPPDLSAIRNAVAYLNPGEISDYLPSDDKGLIAILEKREPAANANDLAKKAAFEKRVLNNKRQIVFLEWLRDRQQEAKVQVAKG